MKQATVIFSIFKAHTILFSGLRHKNIYRRWYCSVVSKLDFEFDRRVPRKRARIFPKWMCVNRISTTVVCKRGCARVSITQTQIKANIAKSDPKKQRNRQRVVMQMMKWPWSNIVAMNAWKYNDRAMTLSAISIWILKSSDFVFPRVHIRTTTVSPNVLESP